MCRVGSTTRCMRSASNSSPGAWRLDLTRWSKTAWWRLRNGMAYFLHPRRENIYVDEVMRELTTMPATTAIAHVIMNRNAGAGDKRALRQEIATAFSAHGWEVEFILVGRHNLHRRIRQVITEGP